VARVDALMEMNTGLRKGRSGYDCFFDAGADAGKM
jgi:hypothetical protein